jgi:hypothetical protein
MDHYTALPSIKSRHLIDLAGSLLESSNIDAIVRHSSGNRNTEWLPRSPSYFTTHVVSNDDEVQGSTLMVATHQLTKALHLLFQHKLIDEEVWLKVI